MDLMALFQSYKRALIRVTAQTTAGDLRPAQRFTSVTAGLSQRPMC